MYSVTLLRFCRTNRVETQYMYLFINPFSNKPWFLRVCRTSLLKTQWENETSNFSFSHFWRTFCHFHQIWNCCLQTLLVWKSLKFVVWERVKEALISVIFNWLECISRSLLFCFLPNNAKDNVYIQCIEWFIEIWQEWSSLDKFVSNFRTTIL